MPEREAVVVSEKPWYASRTMWFNIICGAFLAVEMNVSMLQGIIEPATYAYVVMGVNVVNMAMRAVTKAPVTLK